MGRIASHPGDGPRHGVWLISDEVYSRLVYDGAQAAPSLLDVAEPDDRVIVCNSFSKTWVMTGWRLGWLVLPTGTRDAVAEIVEVVHSGVAPFIQQAGIAAIHDIQAVAKFRAHCAAGRALASQALDGIPARLGNPGVLCDDGTEAQVAPRVGGSADREEAGFRADRRPAFHRLR